MDLWELRELVDSKGISRKVGRVGMWDKSLYFWKNRSSGPVGYFLDSKGISRIIGILDLWDIYIYPIVLAEPVITYPPWFPQNLRQTFYYLTVSDGSQGSSLGNCGN